MRYKNIYVTRIDREIVICCQYGQSNFLQKLRCMWSSPCVVSRATAKIYFIYILKSVCETHEERSTKMTYLVWHIYNSITVGKSKVGPSNLQQLCCQHVMWCIMPIAASLWRGWCCWRYASALQHIFDVKNRGVFSRNLLGNWFYISCSLWLSHWIS